MCFFFFVSKKDSADPSKGTWLMVWVKSRTMKLGTLVNTNAAENIMSDSASNDLHIGI